MLACDSPAATQGRRTSREGDGPYHLRSRETGKELVLNRTNAKAMEKRLHESRATIWPDERIVLKPMTCKTFREMVDCIRVEMREASCAEG